MVQFRLRPKVGEGLALDRHLSLFNEAIDGAFEEKDPFVRLVYRVNLLKTKWRKATILQGGNL